MALRTILTPTRAATFEPLGGDDPNAPFTDPLSHVERIVSHSAFGYYAVAHSEDTAVTHSAVAADGGFTWTGATIEVTTYLTKTKVTWTIATHNLGYKPRFIVGDVNYNRLPLGLPIQVVSPGGHRSIVIYATDDKIMLDEYQQPGNNALPSIDMTYRVRCFRTPGPVAGDGGLLARASRVQMASGAIDSAQPAMRLAKAGEDGVQLGNVLALVPE